MRLLVQAPAHSTYSPGVTVAKMGHVHQPRKLPTVLGREEVERFLQAAPGLKYKAAPSVAYGAGLRAAEVVALKVDDIGSKRMVIRVIDERIEAHIFVAYIAYCLQVTLKYRLKALAPGLTPRAALEKLTPMQMVDVRVPTTDGRVLILPRYTQPDADQKLLLSQLKLTLPDQPPPRIQSQPAKVA